MKSAQRMPFDAETVAIAYSTRREQREVLSHSPHTLHTTRTHINSYIDTHHTHTRTDMHTPTQIHVPHANTTNVSSTCSTHNACVLPVQTLLSLLLLQWSFLMPDEEVGEASHPLTLHNAPFACMNVYYIVLSCVVCVSVTSYLECITQ